MDFIFGIICGIIFMFLVVCPRVDESAYHRAQRYYLCYPNKDLDHYSGNGKDFVVCSDNTTREILYSK